MNKSSFKMSFIVIIVIMVLIGIGWGAFSASKQQVMDRTPGAEQKKPISSGTELRTHPVGMEPVDRALPEVPVDPDLILEKINKMSLDQKIAQMLIVDLNSLKQSPSDKIADQIRKEGYGGVILFRKDMTSIDQTVELIDQLKKSSAEVPLWVGTDQEGGVISRIPWGTSFPGNMALGATGKAELARETGKLIGDELKALGFNLNFAPSLDVNNNPNNPVIGLRSFGTNTKAVGEMGTAMMRGLQEAGVMATMKHFPGHGDTAVDSHVGLPTVSYGLNRLEEVELAPFRYAIERGANMIMTAHITFPKIDSTMIKSKKDGSNIYLPATLSHKVLTDLLRKELKFQGVVVTDALNMQAIDSHFGRKESVIMAIQAGADSLLMPVEPAKTLKWIRQAVKEGRISEERINESVTRILSLKQQYGLVEENANTETFEQKVKRARQVFANPETKRKEREFAEQAVTLLKNDGKLLPYGLQSNKRILLIASDSLLNSMKKQLNGMVKEDGKKRDVHIATLPLSSSWTAEQRQIAASADQIVMGTENLHMNKGERKAAQAVVEQLSKLNKKVAVLAVGAPYDIRYIPNVTAYIALYGSEKLPNLNAGMRAVWGFIQPTGTLPVFIPKLSNETFYPLGSHQNYR